ncbi:MAG: AAA family ATPase [Roseburia sp.]
MSKHIITISREFGSGGRYIGKELASRLGIPFYDKDIIAKVAEETGLSDKFIEKKGEYSPIKSMFAYAFVGRDSTGKSMDDYLYQIQHKVIREIAEKEDCVIVGRCADYILKDNPNSLHVFIYGYEPEKTRRICQLYNKTEKEALAMQRDMDKKRSINYQYYTDQIWGARENYGLSLNSSILGYDACVDILASLYNDKISKESK